MTVKKFRTTIGNIHIVDNIYNIYNIYNVHDINNMYVMVMYIT